MENTQLAHLALLGIQAEIARLNDLQQQIEKVKSGGGGIPAPKRTFTRKRRQMSAEARARLSKMMKARWAKRKAAKA